MSRSYIGPELRRAVARRAEGLCEYCLIHEDDTYFGCEVDHIISEKHGGPTALDNLAVACFACNRRKGSDIASIAPESGRLTRLFNPRLDRWSEHFGFSDESLQIEPRSEIGTVTARILGLNDLDRLLEREALRAIGRYPVPAALRQILRPT
ncbi:MAG TPA: HNH endonuclease signature motif containing protein [Longimicrobiaceae bacterium]